MTKIFIQNQNNNQFKNIVISSSKPFVVPINTIAFEKAIIKFSDGSMISNDYIQNKNGKWDMILKIIIDESSFVVEGEKYKTSKTLEVVGSHYCNSNF